MKTTTMIELDNPITSEERLYQHYRRYIIGQDEAIRRLVRKFTTINILGGQMREPDKPAGIFFLFGTTGSGKTLLAEVTAKIFFGSTKALTKIRCGELQLQHQITTLTGAPPSYVGHDKEPLLTQEKLDRWGFLAMTQDPLLRRYFDLQARIDSMFARRDILSEIERTFNNSAYGYQAQMINQYQEAVTEKKSLEPRLAEFIKERDEIIEFHPEFSDLEPPAYNPEAGYPSIVLIDEFEKADDAVRILLLEILDKAQLTVQGRGGETISFKNTFFFITSNIAQEKMLEITKGKPLGFSVPVTTPEALEKETARVRRQVMSFGYDAIAKSFSPEFVGRVGEDNIFAFAPLTLEEYRECLKNIILPHFQAELKKRFPMTIEMTDRAQEFVVKSSRTKRNAILGMRALNGEFNRLVKDKISSLLATDEADKGLKPGDRIVFDLKDEDSPKLVLQLHRSPQSIAIGEEEFARLQKKRDLELGESKLVPFIASAIAP